MKRAVRMAIAAGVLLCLCSCGNYNNPYYNGLVGSPVPGGNSNSNHPISSLNLRTFVTDTNNSQVDILDAKFDGNYGAVIGVDNGPTLLALTSDHKTALLFSTGLNTFQGIDTTTEAVTASIVMPSWTESFIIAPDNTTLYAALRNQVTSTTAGSVPGALDIMDMSLGAITHTIPIPKAHWVVLSSDGKKLLVFSDDSNSVSLVDTTSFTVTTVAGFDRPVWGVFSSDNSTAYIMNCGAECGGASASVAALNIASATIGTVTPVEGATMGLLDGSTLYVAGTGAGGGKLDILSTPNLTVTKSGIPLSDGYHWKIALISGQLFVGARSCSNTANGCLAIVNTSTATSTLESAPGDVTGIEAIPHRTVVYVVQGGEIVIYDTTTDKPQANQIDIVGKAYDVRYVDQ